MVVGVGHQGARLLDPAEQGRVLVEPAEHHREAALMQAAGQGRVALQDHEGGLDTLQFLDQGVHPGTIAVEQDAPVHGWQDAGQARLETLLEQGQEIDRKDQQDEEEPGDLGEHHEQGHHRVVPAVVGPIARGGQGLGGPLQALPEAPWVPLQVGHPEHVKDAEDHHDGGQGRKQGQQAQHGTA